MSKIFLIAFLGVLSVVSWGTTHNVARDNQCMAVAMWKEANTESLRGKRAVLDVIEYRMKVLDKTACQVIQQPKQFSFYRKGMSLKATEAQLRAMEAVYRSPKVLYGYAYFHAKSVKPKWAAKMKGRVVIGNHVFYK